MFFPRRTKQRLRIALLACAAFVAFAAVVATLLPRDNPGFLASLRWWMIAIPSGLVVYASLEFIGTWCLERPFLQRLPSWARVLLLTALLCCCAAGAAVIYQSNGPSS